MAFAKKILFCSLNNTNTNESSQLQERLLQKGFATQEVRSFEEAQRELLAKNHTVVVIRADEVSEAFFEFLHFIRKYRLPARPIISVKSGKVEDAVLLMKAGAYDFLINQTPDNRVIESIHRCLQDSADEPSQFDGHLIAESGDPEASFIGQSSAICEIRTAIKLVAKSQASVLITGESGVGKEIVARLIHLQSTRAQYPFVAVNCAALPKDVIENELFGHEKGAFTGALPKKIGCFEIAHQGTLFLDEIAEMNPDTQAKLLRAIEQQTFRRLGGSTEVSVDVRFIAATNRDITEVLRTERLRQDLYYRLSVIEMHVPPLRERPEDIPLLAEHFLSIFTEKYNKPLQRFAESTIEVLMNYEWPGNVRELRNVVERAVVICQNEVIEPSFLPERIHLQTRTRFVTIPVGTSVEEAERTLILQTLASVGYNKSKAAQILRVSRKTLHNKLATFGELLKSRDTRDFLPHVK